MDFIDNKYTVSIPIFKDIKNLKAHIIYDNTIKVSYENSLGAETSHTYPIPTDANIDSISANKFDSELIIQLEKLSPNIRKIYINNNKR